MACSLVVIGHALLAGVLTAGLVPEAVLQGAQGLTPGIGDEYERCHRWRLTCTLPVIVHCEIGITATLKSDWTNRKIF
ncbi:hypothetical protein C0J52_03556 [Blattella germanica]|nr:hypothetical protein C0J52_03556 [Blattella germanica]